MEQVADNYLFKRLNAVFWCYQLWWFTGAAVVLACIAYVSWFAPVAALWVVLYWRYWRWFSWLQSIRAMRWESGFCLLSFDDIEPVLCSSTGYWYISPWLIAIGLVDERGRSFRLPVFAPALDANSYRRLRVLLMTGGHRP